MRVSHQDLNLQIPNSLFLELEKQAKAQGSSLEEFCLLLLSQEQEETLFNPDFYQSLPLDCLRKEIPKVVSSTLPAEQMKRRVKSLNFEISRRFVIR